MSEISAYRDGVRFERERIIKLIQEQQYKFIERGQFNDYFLIALIKGENK